MIIADEARSINAGQHYNQKQIMLSKFAIISQNNQEQNTSLEKDDDHFELLTNNLRSFYVNNMFL
jgi:predicted ATPase